MIRLTLLWCVVGGLAVYAWRDWYRALCGLILLMAVLEHPDMPRVMFGIQGFNAWNVLFGVILVAWAVTRRSEGLTWDLPPRMALLLLLYLAVIAVAFGRMMADRALLPAEVNTAPYLVSEYLINTLKWTVPGLLLFDGCRSRERFVVAMTCVLGMYFLLALQVIRWMPASVALDPDALTTRSSKIIVNEIGYHRVTLSAMLAGASWGLLSAREMARDVPRRTLLALAAAMTVYAQGLTAGRAGYVAWVGVGLVLGLLRWRRYVPLAAALIVVVVLAAPGVAGRMAQGFSADTRDVNARVAESTAQSLSFRDDRPDAYTITAGRTLIWPYVVGEIANAPHIGHGRQAMIRTGLAARLWTDLGESFPHPHNAYLEMLLDNGWIGLAVVGLFYGVVAASACRLLLDTRSRVFVAAGGVGGALVLAFLFAGIGSDTFYPRESSVGMWCAIGLVLRVDLERRREFEHRAARASALARQHPV
jgi:O-antigen ligase